MKNFNISAIFCRSVILCGPLKDKEMRAFFQQALDAFCDDPAKYVKQTKTELPEA